MPAKTIIAIGTRFGNLTVVGDAESVTRPNGRKGHRRYQCLCDCGQEVIVRAVSLLVGDNKSCGCTRQHHGLSKTPEYQSWIHMIDRCRNPEHHAYARYGGRGITVCERWLDFEAFYADMAPRPSLEHTIERVDNGEGYSPNNCIWATRKEQTRNTRNNRLVEFNGEVKPLSAWAEITGINHATLTNRLNKGWPVAIALSATPNKGRKLLDIMPPHS